MEENDWVEEDLVVYLDFGKFIPASEINDLELQFKVVGLDSETIFSEVNGKVFEGGSSVGPVLPTHPFIRYSFPGTYDDSMGTHLFFTGVEDQPKSDNIFERSAERTYSLLDKTSKYIAMKRIFVSPKINEEGAVKEDKVSAPARKLVVDKTYQEALDQLLKPGQVAPRTVTDTLDNKIILQRDLEVDCNYDN